MTSGSDGGDDEADAVVAGENAFAIADDLAEALRDVTEAQDAESNVAHQGIAHRATAGSASRRETPALW